MIVNIKRGNKIINSYEVSDNEVKRRKRKRSLRKDYQISMKNIKN